MPEPEKCRACREMFLRDEAHPQAMLCPTCWDTIMSMTKPTRCKSCDTPVVWVALNMSPIRENYPVKQHIIALRTRASHFIDCPHAGQHRKAPKQKEVPRDTAE